jgi:hypothetical protein
VSGLASSFSHLADVMSCEPSGLSLLSAVVWFVAGSIVGALSTLSFRR